MEEEEDIFSRKPSERVAGSFLDIAPIGFVRDNAAEKIIQTRLFAIIEAKR